MEILEIVFQNKSNTESNFSFVVQIMNQILKIVFQNNQMEILETVFQNKSNTENSFSWDFQIV